MANMVKIKENTESTENMEDTENMESTENMVDIIIEKDTKDL